MDYTARYGLEFNPFLKNSKEVLAETQEYKEVLFRLNYLLTTKGFGLLTGSAGRGKTTAIRNWSAGLNPSLYKVYQNLYAQVIGTLRFFLVRPFGVERIFPLLFALAVQHVALHDVGQYVLYGLVHRALSARHLGQ